MIEAMACGAPVIAFNRGSVSEIVEDGVTGFVVEDETSAAGAVREIGLLSRRAVRQRFEERFTARRMAEDYIRLYGSMIEGEHAIRRAAAD
jgi:glycosyltransferase involved in cell wall biosynthesis